MQPLLLTPAEVDALLRKDSTTTRRPSPLAPGDYWVQERWWIEVHGWETHVCYAEIGRAHV